MAGRLAYLDSSAFVKLALDEPEQTAIFDELGNWDGLVSSTLLRVEALQACARYGDEYVANAEAGLGALSLVPLDDRVLELAARLAPPELRSLDALHLATALTLGNGLGVMVVYDKRLQAAATAHGLAVLAPT